MTNVNVQENSKSIVYNLSLQYKTFRARILQESPLKHIKNIL
jgi:hypothetical protein